MRRVLTLLLFLLPATAAAQDRKWEVEGYVGGLVAQPTSAGTRTLPAAGPPIVTSTPTFPSRAVPSWFFGDGASLLNGVLQDFGSSTRITPLDGTFAPLRTRRAAVFGLRVRRRLNARTALEIAVETLDGSPVDVDPIAATVEASRASVPPAFTALFASGPFSGTSVSAQAAVTGGASSETAYTVALNCDVGRLGATQPYVTLGGGPVATTGTLPSAELLARYGTSIAGDVPIDETDRAQLRVTRATAFTAVLGGGLRRDLGPRWALRLDARMLIGPDSTRMALSATPSVSRGTPSGFIESFTNPAIQFSNDPSTGRVSSLSGAPLQDVQVFKGGITARVIVSAGLALRF